MSIVDGIIRIGFMKGVGKTLEEGEKYYLILLTTQPAG